MILIIAEKKELAKAISEAISGEEREVGSFLSKGGYIIAHLGGHVMELKEPEEVDEKYREWKEENLPIYFFPWPMKVKKEKMAIVTQLRQHIKSCEYVIHAGDNDDEGQLLVDEVLTHLKYKGKVMRLDCSNTTKQGLKKAFQNMTDNNRHVNAGKAAYARAISDKAFGYSLTRHFSLLNEKTLNIGRVQTPTLGLVVERDRQIENHKKVIFYDLYGAFNIQDNGVTVLKLEQDDLCKEKGKLFKNAEKLKGKSFEASVIKNEVKEPPPLPFNLVKLQTFCGNAFSYSPEKVMEITQKLRDKYKAITYNRSDCQYLTEEHYREAPEVVSSVLKNLMLEDETAKEIDLSRKSKAFNDKYVTLHFAIIPSGEKINTRDLNEAERNVYTAIVKRYLAQFMPPCKKIITKMIVETEEGTFKAESTKIIDKGYRKLSIKENEEKGNHLNDLLKGNYKGLFSSFKEKEGETKPPKRYTQSSLNEDMTRIVRYVKDPYIKELLLKKDDGKKGENGSIGTVATRASIIKNLIERGYLREEGKKVISTNKGKLFYEALPEEIKKADTTALWWVHQEAITEGKEEPIELTESVLKTINHVIVTSREKTFSTPAAQRNYEHVIGRCPWCGNKVVDVNNKKLKAYVCKNDKCKFIIWKSDFGGQINNTNAMRLLEGKETLAIAMKSKEGKEFKGRLKMTESGKLELVFKNRRKK